MKCKTPTCPHDSGAFLYCEHCRARIRAANERHKTAPKRTKHECETLGCKTIVEPNRHFCDDCLDARKKASKKHHNATRTERNREARERAKKPRCDDPGWLASEEARLREVRQGLNPELWLQRMMRGAMMPAHGVLVGI